MVVVDPSARADLACVTDASASAGTAPSKSEAGAREVANQTVAGDDNGEGRMKHASRVVVVVAAVASALQLSTRCDQRCGQREGSRRCH